MTKILFFVIALAIAAPIAAKEFDVTAIEESAGGSGLFLLNPEDGIYGISMNRGTYIKNTPIFGDYFSTIMKNDKEDTTYAGLGMTIRIMPHWKFAPFFGIGASYNYSIGYDVDEPQFNDDGSPAPEDRGATYWGGHGEIGVRFEIPNKRRFIEILGRYNATDLDGDDRDYWYAGIGWAL